MEMVNICMCMRAIIQRLMLLVSSMQCDSIRCGAEIAVCMELHDIFCLHFYSRLECNAFIIIFIAFDHHLFHSFVDVVCVSSIKERNWEKK